MPLRSMPYGMLHAVRPDAVRIAVLGLIGATMAVVAATAAGAAAAVRMPWRAPPIPLEATGPVWLALGLYWAGLALLVLAWSRLLVGSSVRLVLGLAVLWSIPFLLGPPVASRDVYSYLAQGEIERLELGVYDNGPEVLGTASVTANVDPRWNEVPAPYGPVWIPLSEAAAGASDGDVERGVALLRGVAVAGVGLIGLAVWHLAPVARRARALALTVANPALLLHFVSGAHNDSLMIGLAVCGLAVAATDRPRTARALAGIVLATLGGAVKATALLVAAWIGWHWAASSPDRRIRSIRLGIGGGTAVATLALAGLATGLTTGWVNALRQSRGVLTYLSPPSLLAPVIETLGVSDALALEIAQGIGVALGTLIVLWLAILSGGSPTGAGHALLVVALLVPGTQPWYLLWGLVPLAACKPDAYRGLVAVLTIVATFAALPASPRLDRALGDHAVLGLIGFVALSLVALAWFWRWTKPAGATAALSRA